MMNSPTYSLQLPSQFIVIPRKTSSFSPTQYQLFDTGRFHIYHFGNASEVVDCETGEVKIDFNALCLGEKFTMEFDQGIWLSNGSVQPGYVLEFSLRFSKLGDQAQQSNYPRDCESRVADTNSSEFPVSHPWRHG